MKSRVNYNIFVLQRRQPLKNNAARRFILLWFYELLLSVTWGLVGLLLRSSAWRWSFFFKSVSFIYLFLNFISGKSWWIICIIAVAVVFLTRIYGRTLWICQYIRYAINYGKVRNINLSMILKIRQTGPYSTASKGEALNHLRVILTYTKQFVFPVKSIRYLVFGGALVT